MATVTMISTSEKPACGALLSRCVRALIKASAPG